MGRWSDPQKGIGMKVFVYTKIGSKTIAVFAHVSEVQFDEATGIIRITDEVGEIHSYNRKIVKTRIYQN